MIAGSACSAPVFGKGAVDAGDDDDTVFMLGVGGVNVILDPSLT